MTAGPHPNAAFASRMRLFVALTMIGGALLTSGAILVDLGWFVDVPAIASLGNALSAISGLGLIFLPFGLRASGLGGTGILATVAQRRWLSASVSRPLWTYQRSWTRLTSRREARWILSVSCCCRSVFWRGSWRSDAPAVLQAGDCTRFLPLVCGSP
jgi:hypothetical protein